MTSLRQVEANRRNVLKSTGPRSTNGKHASRRNALRHGFTAETVIEPLENLEEYPGIRSGDSRGVPPPNPGRARARPAAGFPLLATSSGDLDRNRAAADAGGDPPGLPELPPEVAPIQGGGGCWSLRRLPPRPTGRCTSRPCAGPGNQPR